MKTGKEIKTNRFKNYNVVFGSVNNKNPKAIYINISAWVDPIEEEAVNYNQVLRGLNKKLKQSIFNYFNLKWAAFKEFVPTELNQLLN